MYFCVVRASFVTHAYDTLVIIDCACAR